MIFFFCSCVQVSEYKPPACSWGNSVCVSVSLTCPSANDSLYTDVSPYPPPSFCVQWTVLHAPCQCVYIHVLCCFCFVLIMTVFSRLCYSLFCFAANTFHFSNISGWWLYNKVSVGAVIIICLFWDSTLYPLLFCNLCHVHHYDLPTLKCVHVSLSAHSLDVRLELPLKEQGYSYCPCSQAVPSSMQLLITCKQ